MVVSNLGDTVNLGSGWTLTGTRTTGGTFFRVLEQTGATLLLNGPANWHNPVNPNDANNSGDASVSPQGDILPLINEVNRPQFIDAFGRLPDSPVGSISIYYDINGDGFLTATGDILKQINVANQQGAGEGEEVAQHVVQVADFQFTAVERTGEQPIARSRIATTPIVPLDAIPLTAVAAARRSLSATSAVDLLVTEELSDLLEPESLFLDPWRS